MIISKMIECCRMMFAKIGRKRCCRAFFPNKSVRSQLVRKNTGTKFLHMACLFCLKKQDTSRLYQLAIDLY